LAVVQKVVEKEGAIERPFALQQQSQFAKKPRQIGILANSFGVFSRAGYNFGLLWVPSRLLLRLQKKCPVSAGDGRIDLDVATALKNAIVCIGQRQPLQKQSATY